MKKVKPFGKWKKCVSISEKDAQRMAKDLQKMLLDWTIDELKPSVVSFCKQMGYPIRSVS